MGRRCIRALDEIPGVVDDDSPTIPLRFGPPPADAAGLLRHLVDHGHVQNVPHARGAHTGMLSQGEKPATERPPDRATGVMRAPGPVRQGGFSHLRDLEPSPPFGDRLPEDREAVTGETRIPEPLDLLESRGPLTILLFRGKHTLRHAWPPFRDTLFAYCRRPEMPPMFLYTIR